MNCYLKNAKSTPRKMALAANLVRGLTVEKALLALKFQKKKACAILLKALESAVANAKAKDVEPKEFIVSISVGKGMTLKRFMARAKSRSSVIRKTYSNVRIQLDSITVLKQEKKINEEIKNG